MENQHSLHFKRSMRGGSYIEFPKHYQLLLLIFFSKVITETLLAVLQILYFTIQYFAIQRHNCQLDSRATDICDEHCYLNSCKTNIARCCNSFPIQECLTAEPYTVPLHQQPLSDTNTTVSVFQFLFFWISLPSFSLSQRFCAFKIIAA